ncbi:MAG: Asp23/Gls24 family envelope stress response protein [Oscillospiraceae bacterium]|nr:Asp23/Gls24 family envelope stress response protein [Oscillospiraceae bacterium]
MVKIKTPLGTVALSSEYFANLVGNIASDSYGVKGMATRGPVEGLRAKIFKNDFPEKGVRVYDRGGNFTIDIHIKVVYGVNISAVVESLSQKVKYFVEQATGLTVHIINIFVDEMEAE